ncbi:MAG: amidase [Clostridia bacterium]|nr:amidase [Clostridia bacterium]
MHEICDKIDRLNPEIQAFLPEEGRRERLLKDAAKLEQLYGNSPRKPPLYGVPVGLKDLIRTDGLPTRAGSKLPPGVFGGAEAECVSKLRTAGALIIGKTVTTEFAYYEPGPTRNPHNLEHTPGGSSSGSAAAIAAGMCTLALGTQTVGSIIRPAAFCGIIGFKPSYGRISRDGVIDFSPSMDHVGIFAPDVAGIKQAALVLCTRWSVGEIEMQLETGDEEPPILGVPEGPYLEQALPETLEFFEKQLTRLKAAGYIIKRVPLFADIKEINTRHSRLIAAEVAQVHKSWFSRFGELYGPRIAGVIKTGQMVNEGEAAEMEEEALLFREEIHQVMKRNGVECWVAPSALGEAPQGLLSTGDPAMNLPWTHAGVPAINLPAGKGRNGLPLGLQFVAPFMRDEALLVWADDLERVLT